LKVAFLSYAFGKEALGIGKYGWYVVNELRKLGVHIDVFTTRLHLKSVGPPLFYIKNLSLKLKDYDLVHSNEGAGLFLSQQYMIETYHHDYKQAYDLNSLVFHGLETLQLRKVRHIVVPSIGTKNTLLRYGFTEDRISVIHHGVDRNVFRKNESSRIFLRKKYGISNLFVVINVGQLIKRKRQIDIVRALDGVPNTAFVLVGSGEEEKNIKKMARKSGVRLIRFRYVSERSLVDLYNAADVYVHTSVLEGFGLTVLEAMACGLPIIAYNVADFTEIVREAGVLLKPEDLHGVRDALLWLKDNLAERERLSQIAQKESAKYTWEKAAKEHLTVYLRAINESQK
jgi:glycosyltransferase involved in cell wall biosynthesis